MKDLFITIKSYNGCKVCIETVNDFAPIKQNKKKNTRESQMPFMTKELSKEILARSRLRNNLKKNRTEENKIRYTK